MISEQSNEESQVEISDYDGKKMAEKVLKKQQIEWQDMIQNTNKIVYPNIEEFKKCYIRPLNSLWQTNFSVKYLFYFQKDPNSNSLEVKCLCCERLYAKFDILPDGSLKLASIPMTHTLPHFEETEKHVDYLRHYMPRNLLN